MDAVARAWDAVTVSEIASLARSERQGLKTNQISAQLKQLVDNQIIEIEPRAKGRNHLYRLQERFFNIWYLMRYSTRQDKLPHPPRQAASDLVCEIFGRLVRYQRP